MIKFASIALASVATFAARISAPTTGNALKTLTKTLEQLEVVAVHHEAQVEKHYDAVIKSEARMEAVFAKADAIAQAAEDKHDAFAAATLAKQEAAKAEAERATKVRERLAALLA